MPVWIQVALRRKSPDPVGEMTSVQRDVLVRLRAGWVIYFHHGRKQANRVRSHNRPPRCELRRDERKCKLPESMFQALRERGDIVQLERRAAFTIWGVQKPTRIDWARLWKHFSR